MHPLVIEVNKAQMLLGLGGPDLIEHTYTTEINVPALRPTSSNLHIHTGNKGSQQKRKLMHLLSKS
jgi:hypothetical protein